MFEDLLQSSEIALNDCCSLKRYEKLLVICDPPSIEIGRSFYTAAENRCQETVLIMVSPSNRPGMAEFPESVIEILRRFDVAVLLLSSTVSNFQAKQIIKECGIRIASFPYINADIFTRTMQTDWRKIGVITRKIAGRLSMAKKVRVVNEFGTDFTFEVNSSSIVTDDGRLSSGSGLFILPAGQVILEPGEGTVEGKVAVDSISLFNGKLEKSLVLKFLDGYVCEVENHYLAPELEKHFSKCKEISRYISSLGIGTLDTAKVNGSPIEDKVARGAVQLIFGRKVSGDSINIPPNIEAVISPATVIIDGKILIQNGIPV